MRRSIFRLTALLLALLMLLATVGCKGSEDPTSEPAEPSETSSGAASDIPGGDPLQYKDPAETLAGFPAYSFSSSALVIATDPASSLCTHREMLSAALSDIYSAIEEKYNTFVYLQTYEKDALFDACKTAVTNGTYFADLVAIPLSELPRYHDAGLLMPVRLLPFLKTTDAGLDAAAMEALSFGGEQYAVLGSGSLPQLGITTLLFNEELLKELKVTTDPLTLAREGKWTWDAFLSLLDELTAAGRKDALLGTTLDAARLQKAVETVYPAPADAAATVAKLPKTVLSGGEATRAFNDGKLPFLFTTVDSLYEYPHSESVWSCLPMPKAAESDPGYSCLYDPDSTYVYVVLDRTVRTDYAGIYLRAVNAAAEGACVSSLAYELLSGFVRTESCIEMFVKLLESAKVGK